METKLIRNSDVMKAAALVAAQIIQMNKAKVKMFPVPRGGIPAAYAIGNYLTDMEIVQHPSDADIIIDDLIDSGATKKKFEHYEKPFLALFDKNDDEYKDRWLVLPWEGESDDVYDHSSADDIPTRLLQYIGEDTNRGGLIDTPKRVLKAWTHWTSGYGVDIAKLLKVFEDGAEDCNEMVVVRDIPVYSHCIAGSTLISTLKGKVPIQELKHGDWVYCVDPSSKELHVVQCENPGITRKDAELVRVHTGSGTVECTPDHRFLTHKRGWVEAHHLNEGDSLVSLYHEANKDSGRLSISGLRKSGSKQESIQYNKDRLPTISEQRFVADYFGLTKEFLDRSPKPSRKFPNGIVHHKNEDPTDNTPENLEVLTVGEHNDRHQRTQKLAHNEVRKKRAAESSGRPEVRKRRSESVKKSWRKRKQEAQQCVQNHCVHKVEKLSYTEDVYCMTIPKYKNFFANEVCVHNCEHHLAAIFGTASVAYIPDGKIVGLSKISRVVDAFARRLQVQERLTNQIADALTTHLRPQGVAVTIRARHMCMESRGVCQQGHHTITSALRGAFKENQATRDEFFKLTEPGGKM